MEKLIEILNEIEAGVDYENCKTLIDDGYLDSLAIISLVAEIEEEYDVQIPTVEIVPENFNSAEAIYELIKKIQEEG